MKSTSIVIIAIAAIASVIGIASCKDKVESNYAESNHYVISSTPKTEAIVVPEVSDFDWIKSWLAGEPLVSEHQGCLVELGYNLGSSGPLGNGIDGVDGPKTWAAQDSIKKVGGLSKEQAKSCVEGIKKVRYVIAAHKASTNVVSTAPVIPNLNNDTVSVRSNAPTTTGYFASPTPTYWAGTCPNGSCYGNPSVVTGNSRTTFVHDYYRHNGTHVGASYRSHR